MFSKPIARNTQYRSLLQIVQRPPMFTVTPQHLYMRKLGESLEIPCDARNGDDSHRPAIMWYKVRLIINQLYNKFNL